MTARRCILFVAHTALCVACAFAEPTSKPAPIFARDVAPIIFQRCTACHHQGGPAPFSLLTYDDVKKRATQIVDVTQKRFMPPWLPTEGADHFASARKLSDQELQTLATWVNAGAPPGDLAQAPAPRTFTQDWQLGQPNLILETPPYNLPAQEGDIFRNFVVPVPFDSPRWVAAIELRPSNPRVTHHARLGIDSSNESVRRDAEDPEPGYAGMAWGQDPEGQLVIWAPGMTATPAVPDVAWLLYPRAALVLHIHMQPSGKPEVVQFRIGIHFAKAPPQIRPIMLRIGSCEIDIPAGEKHHVVKDQYTLPIDVDVQTIFPHAHSLCSQVSVVANFADGSTKPLITINHFDENWHDLYRFRAPIRLPHDTRIISTFAYDNTEQNIRNRNHPPKRVVYGSNVSDEMADVYLQATPVRADQRAVLMEDYKSYQLGSQLAGHTKALELNPADPWNQEALASCYVGLGQPAKAVDILENRIKTGPSAVFPVAALGMSLLATGDVTRADTELRKAISMDDQYPLAWLGLGKTLAAETKFTEAAQALARAVELAPGLLDARLALADLLIKQGNLDEAERICISALDDSPDVASIELKLGEIAARRKDYPKALDHFTAAQRAAPYTHPPKVVLAIYLLSTGEQEQGMKYLRESRAQSPDYPMPALLLAQLAIRQQRLDEAKKELAAAASIPIPDTWPESHRRRFLTTLQAAQSRLAGQLGAGSLP
jgi:tetratricopeptide (TPR) repeat protein